MMIVALVVLLGCLCLSSCAQQEGQDASADPAWQIPDLPVSLALPEGATVQKDLAYVNDDNVRHKLDLYLPAQGAAPYPLIIAIHGGAWVMFSKDNCPAVFLVQHGYAVASINYRLATEAVFPAQIYDCKAAVRWLRAHAAEYKLDAQRFGVWGQSAGGHLAALLGTSGDVKDLEGNLGNAEYSSRVQAVCDWFGPTDLTKLPNPDNPSAPQSLLLGGLVKDHMAQATAANPITHVSKDDPPFVIVHGTKDDMVPIEQSQLLYEALKQAGVSVTFIPVEGAGHGLRAFDAQAFDAVRAFFDRQFKVGEAGTQAP